jgi:predicted PurR-regulated permease PerM
MDAEKKSVENKQAPATSLVSAKKSWTIVIICIVILIIAIISLYYYAFSCSNETEEFLTRQTRDDLKNKRWNILDHIKRIHQRQQVNFRRMVH